MSMHKIPLTPLEEEGLRLHGLPAGVPNQRSDTFRQGMAWALKALASKHGICLDCGELYEHHYTEPFASCKCHCSEWHEMTPHMEAVKKAAEPTSAEYDLRKEDVPEGLALCRMTDLIAKDPKMNREDELLLVPRGTLSAVWNALCASKKKDLAVCVEHHLKTSAVFPPDWRPMAMSALTNWEKGFPANDMADALRLFLNKP